MAISVVRCFVASVLIQMIIAQVTWAQRGVQPASTSRVAVADSDLRDAQTTGQRLLDQSRDSFGRGLMPLPDYLDQLSMATELNVRLARSTNQKVVQHQWVSSQVRQLESAVTQLNRFQQPASAGWQADLFLAKFSLAAAQFQLAKLDDRPEQAEAAQTRAAEFARQHLDKRMDDASIGHASPLETWRAISLLNQTESRSSLANRAALQDAFDAAKRWNVTGAGIGRNDLRDALEYELARVDLNESMPGTQAFTKNAERAESILVKLQQTATRYHSTGTASLYDVAATWRERSELHAFLQSKGEDFVPKAWKQRRDSDLQDLQRLAARTTDLRGRHAADRTYIELLSLVEKTANVR
jgi:hypothetical protein